MLYAAIRRHAEIGCMTAMSFELCLIDAEWVYWLASDTIVN